MKGPENIKGDGVLMNERDGDLPKGKQESPLSHTRHISEPHRGKIDGSTSGPASSLDRGCGLKAKDSRQ